MLRQHKRNPNQKERNHEKPTQACTCYELKVTLEDCNESVSLVAAGNNISVINDSLRNYTPCREGSRRVCVLNCYYLLALPYAYAHS